MRTIWLSLALLLGLAVAPVLAAGIPVEVSADSFTVDEQKHQAVFSGNVVIKRKGLDLTAEKVTIIYGAGGQTDIESLTATGGVRIRTAGQTATGDVAVFDPGSQLIKLSGNVAVTSAQGTLKGPELIVNLANDTSTFKGSEGGRVTGVFTPQ